MWILRHKARLEVSPGFLLMLGILFWLDEGVGLLFWGLVACLIHELSHVVMSILFGGRVTQLSLTAVGAELTFFYRTPLSYSRDSAVALAGPAANLIAGGIALLLDCYLLAALSLGIGAFNLLPIQPMDGGRVLYNLLSELLDQDWAERIMTAVAGCLVGLLVGVGVIVTVQYANVTLLFTALWLLLKTFQQGRAGESLVLREEQNERES